MKDTLLYLLALILVGYLAAVLIKITAGVVNPGAPVRSHCPKCGSESFSEADATHAWCYPCKAWVQRKGR